MGTLNSSLSGATRDTRRSESYWDDVICAKRSYLHDEDAYAKYKLEVKKSNNIDSVYNLFTVYTEDFMYEVNSSYSRGDVLEYLKSFYIDEGVERYTKLSIEIERYRSQIDSVYLYSPFKSPHRVHSTYTLLAWLVCFGVSDEKIAVIAPYIAPAGRDRLVDVVLARYQHGREISSVAAQPKIFGLLDAVIDANEIQRIELLEKHLDSWAKRMAGLKGLASLGGAHMAFKARSNSDLNKISERSGYVGFWAWEVALVARFFDIDDSAFADHELYPSDLARFLRAQ